MGASSWWATSPASRHIDASGLIVAPGSIGCHTHDDQLLLQHPTLHPKLLPSVTTASPGNCGVSLAPLVQTHPPAPLDLLGAGSFRIASFAAYVQGLHAAQPALNAAVLVGQITLRIGAVANPDRATASEVLCMQQALAQALDAGAIGMSTGVYYPPACAATTQELIDVGQPLRGGRALAADVGHDRRRRHAARGTP